tara:strand:+ start:84 stop:419 length:336 start_codon:yes stop_codon:yes gene_type:complete
MGVRIFVGHEDGYDHQEQAVLMCNTTDTVFGPFFDSVEEARMFLEWCDDTCQDDPRQQDFENKLSGNIYNFQDAREKGWQTGKERAYAEMCLEEQWDELALEREASEKSKT